MAACILEAGEHVRGVAPRAEAYAIGAVVKSAPNAFPAEHCLEDHGKGLGR